jgi:hypothetical protein
MIVLVLFVVPGSRPRLGSFFQIDSPRDPFFPRLFTIASIRGRFAGNPWSKVRLSGLKWTHFGGMKAAWARHRISGRI